MSRFSSSSLSWGPRLRSRALPPLLLTGRKSGPACRLPPVSEVVPSTDTGEQRAVRGWAGIPRRARPLPEFEARTSQAYRSASAARSMNLRRQTPPAHERPQETWLTKSG